MPTITQYDRSGAAAYAKEWAFARNPKYANFDSMGGDCTNFVSQCIFAGSGIMNYTPVFGWYYVSLNDRAPSWTGVEFLHKFIVTNDGIGVFGSESRADRIEVGDVIFLSDDNKNLYHSLIVVSVAPRILIASHTFDAYAKPLLAYAPTDDARYVHIEGVRVK